LREILPAEPVSRDLAVFDPDVPAIAQGARVDVERLAIEIDPEIRSTD
jgi:hypothetical protein